MDEEEKTLLIIWQEEAMSDNDGANSHDRAVDRP